jgi:hypothetical protein
VDTCLEAISATEACNIDSVMFNDERNLSCVGKLVVVLFLFFTDLLSLFFLCLTEFFAIFFSLAC